tara:strand:- start:2783 stop:3133 length:351 start_codon:yes stop_codon:yes gene_type:complete
VAPGLHGQIRLDHGSELIAGVFVDWCADNEIELAYFQPDKLQQNGFAERFNGTFRRAFLNAYLFEDLPQVRDMAWVWMMHDDEERGHAPLGKLPPVVVKSTMPLHNDDSPVELLAA